jgi:hypothetical protein
MTFQEIIEKAFQEYKNREYLRSIALYEKAMEIAPAAHYAIESVIK